MNWKNPTGRVGYRSLGRRNVADDCAGYGANEPTDRLYRALLGCFVRATAKIATLPPQAVGLRKMATQKQRIAFDACGARLQQLIPKNLPPGPSTTFDL